MRGFLCRRIRCKRDIREAVVTELLADSGKVVDDWDRVRRKMVGRSNAREKEDVRGSEGACR